MRILHITDIHAHYEIIKNVLDREYYDILIISGDITHFGGKKELSELIPFLDKSKSTLVVTGNCDYPECALEAHQHDISLENKVLIKHNIQFIGIGGSLPCPGSTPNEYSEEDFDFQLTRLSKQLTDKYPTILVSHQPPYRTLNDKVLLGFHVGSKIIRKFIEEKQPLLCLTGHIHEGKGIDFIGECQIVNPGSLRNNHYAAIDIKNNKTADIQLF